MAKIKLESIRALVEPLLALRQPWSNDLRNALDRTQTNIERLNTKLAEIESLVSSISFPTTSPAVVVYKFFLTGAFEVPIPDDPNGTVIIYRFRQDSTGSHTVTFPAAFIGVFPDQVSTDADSITSLAFLKEADNELVPLLAGMSHVDSTP